jgi:hypothetical protein
MIDKERKEKFLLLKKILIKWKMATKDIKKDENYALTGGMHESNDLVAGVYFLRPGSSFLWHTTAGLFFNPMTGESRAGRLSLSDVAKIKDHNFSEICEAISKMGERTIWEKMTNIKSREALATIIAETKEKLKEKRYILKDGQYIETQYNYSM